MLKTRIQTLERDVSLMIDGLEGDYSRAFGRAARMVIEEQDRRNDTAAGRDISYRTFVDGRETEMLETARRMVVAEWDVIETALRSIHHLLREAAPVLKGEYRDSIMLFANEVAYDVGESIPEAESYYFASSVPYARKIERGLSRQAPDGVFEAVAAVAGKRFGNIARVRFGYRSLRGGGIGAWAETSQTRSQSNSRNRSGAKRHDWLTRQPAITVAVK